MNYKINKKDYIICIIKNKNINEGSFYKLKLDNLICIYNKNNSTNLMYNKRCEKYIKKECFILNCISKKKNLEKQFICLDFHPYTKIYLRNNFPDYFNNIGTNSHNLIIFSSDIHFNKLYNNIN